MAGGRQATLRVWDVAKWGEESAPIFATEPNGTTVHYLGVASVRTDASLRREPLAGRWFGGT